MFAGTEGFGNTYLRMAKMASESMFEVGALYLLIQSVLSCVLQSEMFVRKTCLQRFYDVSFCG